MTPQNLALTKILHKFRKTSTPQGAVLNITGVKRTDSGSYTVQAKNDEGKSNFTMVLNVQCEQI